jgi:hypothetical protein
MKLEIEGNYLKIIKAIFDKPIANVIVNGEKLKPFSQKSGMRQGCPLFLLLFNIVLKYLGRRNKRNANRKGRSQIIPMA